MGAGAAELLELAADLGRRIVDEAIWHQDVCNWVGADIDDSTATPDYVAPAYCALGPNLYGGTAGVALFLAELWGATGEAEYRRTALGGIRQALGRAGRLPPDTAGGFHVGGVGIAYGAARIGVLLGEAELVERARGLVTGLKDGPAGFDLISGKAGAILGLLSLSGLLDESTLLNRAVRLGDALLSSADTDGPGYSWKTPGETQQHPLCGLSHGAAGAGCALVELYGVTGAEAYRRAAEGAFDYEHSWYDPEARNWPDLRDPPGRRGRIGSRPRTATLWCHGAPGIALSRLRAFEITGDQRHRADAAVALETTAESIRTELDLGPRDFSLCHGLAGKADVLLVGAQSLPEERGRVALAAAVARTGRELYGERAAAWPCGVPTGETQSLFLGLAGIGYFYLRVRDPGISSPLVVHGADVLAHGRYSSDRFL